jgi:hypothetical protein
MGRTRHAAPDPGCGGIYAGRSLDAFERPRVVHAFARRLYTLCELRLGGIEVPDGRRTRPTDLDPDALQARLIDAYPVDLLPEDAVSSLFHQPPTAQTSADMPSIRPVAVDAP